MVKWFENLYMDEKVKRRKKHCMKRVESGKLLKKSYTVIALASNEEALFDIIESREFFFRHYQRSEIYIAGLASGYDSALELLSQMLKDSFEGERFVPKEKFSKKRFYTR